jgi:ferrous iron transport protein A
MRSGIMVTSLDQIGMGGKGVIREINTDHITKERLESLGLINGVEIEAIRKSPLGSPKIYRCLNTLVALRNDISKRIQVEVPHE